MSPIFWTVSHNCGFISQHDLPYIQQYAFMSHYDFILLLTIFVLTERQKQVPPYESLFLPLNKKINSDFFLVIASLHKYDYIYINIVYRDIKTFSPELQNINSYLQVIKWDKNTSLYLAILIFLAIASLYLAILSQIRILI